MAGYGLLVLVLSLLLGKCDFLESMNESPHGSDALFAIGAVLQQMEAAEPPLKIEIRGGTADSFRTGNAAGRGRAGGQAIKMQKAKWKQSNIEGRWYSR